ncbi:MAG: hypothetical protein AB1646_20050 [Thermodesulfobacteriota bacterium]
MKTEQKVWLDENAVSCRVFRGRWSVRHCLRMYQDIKDLKIQMSSRAEGKVTKYESTYNPCEHCRVLAEYIRAHAEEAPPMPQTYQESVPKEMWAV